MLTEGLTDPVFWKLLLIGASDALLLMGGIKLYYAWRADR